MKKKYIKSDFKEIFLKLAANDQSDKMFLLTSKVRPPGVFSPCSGAIYMYKIMKKNCIKSDFKEIVLKLVAKDRSDLTSNGPLVSLLLEMISWLPGPNAVRY